MKTTVIFISFLLLAIAKEQKAQYRHRESETFPGTYSVTCECSENEDIDVFYNTVCNISSLTVSSCASAILGININGLSGSTLKQIKVENITNTMTFAPVLTSENLKSIEFSNIGYIPDITTANTFHSVRKMDLLAIKNTTIGKFNQLFYHTNLTNVTLKDVLIKQLEGLSILSYAPGETLEIINCHIVVTASPVHLQEFRHILIMNSTFEFNHTGVGNMLISGDYIRLSNNNIINASVEVTGNHTIEVTNTCGDGSTMRLHSPKIESHGNNLTSEITYWPQNNAVNKTNNHSCTGGKCHCSPNEISRRTSRGDDNGQTRNNAVRPIHRENSNAFFLCLTMIASFVVTKV